jgi:endonuclease V-like protein UPF0215 family
MKDQIRVLGIDDGPFKFGQKTVPIIGVMMRAPNYIEGISRSKVNIDGNDSNKKIIEMLNNSHYLDQIRLIMFDGVALGGFNVVDIEKLYNKFEIPITTITRTKPELDVIKDTLKKHFEDWQVRWEAINNLELIRIETNFKPIYIKHIGISLPELKRIIALTTVRGVLPEPIRIAHMIATAMVKGESSGKA